MGEKWNKRDRIQTSAKNVICVYGKSFASFVSHRFDRKQLTWTCEHPKKEISVYKYPTSCLGTRLLNTFNITIQLYLAMSRCKALFPALKCVYQLKIVTFFCGSCLMITDE